MKYTPGPWVVSNERVTQRRVFVPTDVIEIRKAGNGLGAGLVCCTYAKNWMDCDQGNANLLAAAPELYEALKACATALRSATWADDEGDDAVDLALAKADDAIAKAEGRD